YRRAEFERLREREGGAGHVEIRLVPGPDVVFRPEEVEGGSERGADAPGVGLALADPHHEAGGRRFGTGGIDRERERRAGLMAARGYVDALAEHRGDPERVDRAARVSLLAVRQADA